MNRQDAETAKKKKFRTVYYKLIVVATSKKTDIWLADDGGHLVQKEIGTLRTRILPGSYTVEFGLGNQTYPILLTKAARYTQTELIALGPCPRPKIRLLPEYEGPDYLRASPGYASRLARAMRALKAGKGRQRKHVR